jgi:predicted Zn-dependent protease with MMP-like domain
MNDVPAMPEEAFRTLAGEVWDQMPEKWEKRIDNVALLIEDEPSAEVRRAEKLPDNETLLGLYHGIPESVRGGAYGVGVTLPDTITLYRLPILDEAAELMHTRAMDVSTAIREAIRETLWHEVGHYFGLHEEEVRTRERGGTNRF